MAPLNSTSLATLPPELLLKIITHLRFDDRVRLRNMSRLFFAVVPTPTLIELLAIETEEWALEKRLLACSGCLQLRRSSDFSYNMLSRGTGKRSSMELFPRDRRLCYGCAEPGLSIEQLKLRCRGCGRIVESVDGIMGMCERCYEEECKEEIFEDERGWASLRKREVMPQA